MIKRGNSIQKSDFFIAVPFGLIFVLAGLVLAKDALGPAAIVYYGAGCLVLYLTTIISIILVLTPGREILGEHTEEIGAILLAAVLPALVIAAFAIGWHNFHQFAANLSPPLFSDLSIYDLTNSAYISAVTFTSTGYGDFVPTGWAGRWYALLEAFIGHVHAAVFFGLLFSRVERWRSVPSKKQAKTPAI